MTLRGEIIAHEDDLITVRLIDSLDVETVKKQAYNGKYYVTVDVFEKDSITDEQRRHFLALCGDISEYEGVPVDAVQAKMKYDFMKEEGLTDYPSIARNKLNKTTASKLIEFTVLHCVYNGIPFRKQQFYLTTDTSKMLFALTMKRICWVCGKRADIHHASNLVGMGNKRSKHNHEESTFMALCREHHNEIHNRGYTDFCEEHHLKAIKLNQRNIKELGL